MARFDERSGQLYMTELGRVASHFYIRHASIVAFEEHLQPRMSQAQVIVEPRCVALPLNQREQQALPAMQSALVSLGINSSLCSLNAAEAKLDSCQCNGSSAVCM